MMQNGRYGPAMGAQPNMPSPQSKPQIKVLGGLPDSCFLFVALTKGSTYT